MNWFRNLKVRQKLTFGFGLLALMVIIIGGTGITEVTRISGKLEDMYINRVEPIRDLGYAKSYLIEARCFLYSAITLKDLNDRRDLIKKFEDNLGKIDEILDNYSRNNLAEEEASNLKVLKEQLGHYKTDIREGIAYIEQLNDSLAAQHLNEETEHYDAALVAFNNLIKVNDTVGKELYSDTSSLASFTKTLVNILTILSVIAAFIFGRIIIRTITGSINKVQYVAEEMQKGHVKVRTGIQSDDEFGLMGSKLDQFLSQVESSIVGALNRIAQGDVSFTAPLYDDKDEIAPVLNKVTSAVRELISETNNLTKEAIEGNLSIRGNSSKFQGGYREIVDGMNKTLDAVIIPVKEGSDILHEMAAGNLTARVKGDYKGDHQLIKNSINGLAESMNNALGEVDEAVMATANAANEISASSEELASGAQLQNQQITEVAGAVEEMTKTIFETSSNINVAADISKQASDTAEKGKQKVKETKNGIEKIVNSTEVTGKIITSLARKTDQIGEIAQVIDDIADQTNLLALNAAIEAARAGEQGRGFAVVADEVRKLAERTTKATKEIADTIKAIQDEAKQADQSMEGAKSLVEQGMKLTEEVAQVLQEMMDGALKASDVISRVAVSSEEQSATAEQISKNIDGINSVTQQSAAGTEQIAKAAGDLSNLTINLQQLVKKFKLDYNNNLHASKNYLTQSAVIKNKRTSFS
jgi:methyl-accepting chemotaxis protein